MSPVWAIAPSEDAAYRYLQRVGLKGYRVED
jgi:hypothetical protein